MTYNFFKKTSILFIALLLIFSLAITAISSERNVKETILPNGLKILTKEVHASPVVAFQIWYRVGSRNEMPGKTGLSHLLEHMMFKGTKKFGKGEIDRLLRENGAMSNAGTWKDFTYYYETLSSSKLELAMKIESDRMVNSLLDPKEFEAEKIVVRSELEGRENEPDSLMLYELYALAYKSHPYQWPTIGWKTDVEKATRTDLYKYYRTFYKPNNATIVITGDFDTNEAIDMVKKYFGSIPKGLEPPKVTAIEPAQYGEKRSVIRKSGAASRVLIGFHTPALGDKDNYALDVAELVLSSGRSSRLYKALIDKQLATSAWGSALYGKDPNLFVLGGTARDGVNIEDVEAALLAEVEKLKTELITEEELQKALNQLEANFIYTNDSVTDQAQQLGYFETLYTWRFIDDYLINAKKVTAEDVQSAVKKYLTLKNSSTVTFIPDASANTDRKTSAKTAEAAYKPNLSAALEKGFADETYGGIKAKPESKAETTPHANGMLEKKNDIKPARIVLDNGIVLIIQENKSNATVAVSGSLNAGSAFDPTGKSGLAQITANMLDKGTSARDAKQIGFEKDFVGMSISFGAGMEYASFSGYSLSKYFEKMLDLMSDILRNPSFPEDELNKLKSIRLSGIKEQMDSPEAIAFRTFNNTAFPAASPYHQLSIEDELANTASIQKSDVEQFYKKFYMPNEMTIAITGDVDTNDAIELVKKYFGTWEKSSNVEQLKIDDTPLPNSIIKNVQAMPDKSQVEIVLGYPGGLKRTDKDFYAANVMNFILGGGGALGSRLGDEIRDKMGLAYNVYSYFDASRSAGPWISYIGTNPQNADTAIETLISQMNLMLTEGAKESELKEAVNFLTGSFPVRLETNSQIASTLRAAEYYGLGIDYIRNYDKIYNSITLNQVNEAAKKYLHPDKYILVIAGPYKEKMEEKQ